MRMTDRVVDRIIEMAWEDRTTFDAIEYQFGLKEQEVIQLMRRELKPSSFRLWRKRVQGRATKHQAKRDFVKGRFKCTRQKSISNNNIAKR
ncbi:TIGR03643 family protein [Tenacibaculum tangerinum]|uniref:TIGR03643 family protein n=1 Tax=Tenacibaculum tangerinum TaxID=3038772 RepID=A0ABY8KZ42_9FLAO|nr:TIGR03643 family protein [Tenacibaculum tangerinum]WGH74271.1 TIGR03643 family protein [Tenacibaculum tangerinum]